MDFQSQSGKKYSYSKVLLSTAVIKGKNSENEYVDMRALLDSGSQNHFITEKACKLLKLRSEKIEHIVKGVGQGTTTIKNEVKVLLKSRYNDHKFGSKCLVINKIKEKLPINGFDMHEIKLPNYIYPNNNIPSDIDKMVKIRYVLIDVR